MSLIRQARNAHRAAWASGNFADFFSIPANPPVESNNVAGGNVYLLGVFPRHGRWNPPVRRQR